MGLLACVAVVTGTWPSFGSVSSRCSAAERALMRACVGVVGSAVSLSVTSAARETAFLVAGSLSLWGTPSPPEAPGWRWVPSARKTVLSPWVSDRRFSALVS